MPRDWEAYYSDPANLDLTPHPLLVQVAELVPPGRALDLACGAGRNARYLAQLGWQVTAIDSSPAALRQISGVDAQLADLESPGFRIAPETYDLICDFHYLYRPLFPQIREGLRPGGTFAAAVHLLGSKTGPGNPSFLLHPGELRAAFSDWKILYYSETDEARLIARRA